MATKAGQKYSCAVCGNETVVTKAGAGVLVCCGKPMQLVGEGYSCEFSIPTGTD
ncbi:MAG TPA: desulfoferrodoxin FeS4 iron-binding domain-containing protein [Dissulfurispiraceae bacterium]|nr:desulfoferrodoxin FeS4 iron-binding domain-containing protein [Dissulfurispiraceae bacterium]